jgi:hypothetical protein
MATSQTVDTAVGAHLVGGLQAPDAETAMRTTAGILGRHLRALTDGETGDRAQWIWWQIGKLTAVDGITVAGTHGIEDADNPDYSEFPALAIDPSVSELPVRSLGYADDAEASYATFRRLREEGVVPEGVRFQVSIPTPYATVVAWVTSADQASFFPIYADAIANEVAEIARVIDAADLAIQYDVAVEIGALTGNFDTGGDLGEKRFVVDALKDILERTPSDVDRGLHFCYGDYKHRHFTVPEDLSLCVELANAVGDAADFVHMPADRETGREPAYFEPLRDGRRRNGVRGRDRVRHGAHRRARPGRAVARTPARAARRGGRPDPLGARAVEAVSAIQEVDRVHRGALRAVGDLPAARLAVARDRVGA